LTISRIVVVSFPSNYNKTELLFRCIQFYCHQLNCFFFYKTGYKEEDIDTPLIDVSDIFDIDDEDQNKKPRACEDHRTRKVDDRLLDSVQCDNDKLDHDDVDLNQKPRDEDDHRKRKVDEQLLDSVQCDNDKLDHDDVDQNPKPRAEDDNRKRKVDDQLLDYVQCDIAKDKNKKQRADEEDKG
jgi:hypothetical protein